VVLFLIGKPRQPQTLVKIARELLPLRLFKVQLKSVRSHSATFFGERTLRYKENESKTFKTRRRSVQPKVADVWQSSTVTWITPKTAQRSGI